MTSSTFRATCVLTVVLLLALAATPSFATVTGLFGTGAGLPCGGFPGPPDPNYDLVSAPTGVPLHDARTTRSFPGWVDPTPSGTCWINPYGNESAFAPGGSYDYKTTFNEIGSLSMVNGMFAGDNDACVFLNGSSIAAACTVNPDHGFEQLTPFTIDASTPGGLHLGTNTLDFIVRNDDGTQSGLLVAFPTPEPSSMMLFGSGILGLAGLLRRKLMG